MQFTDQESSGKKINVSRFSNFLMLYEVETCCDYTTSQVKLTDGTINLKSVSCLHIKHSSCDDVMSLSRAIICSNFSFKPYIEVEILGAGGGFKTFITNHVCKTTYTRTVNQRNIDSYSYTVNRIICSTVRKMESFHAELESS